jgi:hypothetical protein
MEKQEREIDQQVKELAKKLEPFIQQMKGLYVQAYATYKPLVDDICRKDATEKEVGWLLTWMLDFADDDNMLLLYRRVCRAYWQKYPETVAYYIMEYRKMYDPESLIGTEYEYLLHEDEEFETKDE